MKKEIIRFIFAGVVNTVFYYLLYSLFIYFGLDYKISVLLATLFGVFFSFKTFSRYVFKSGDNSGVYRFVLVYIVLYFSNIFLISIFELYVQNYYISGFIATLCCAVLSFVLNKWYVFRG
jgi:putative flippase GtrA